MLLHKSLFSCPSSLFSFFVPLFGSPSTVIEIPSSPLHAPLRFPLGQHSPRQRLAAAIMRFLPSLRIPGFPSVAVHVLARSTTGHLLSLNGPHAVSPRWLRRLETMGLRAFVCLPLCTGFFFLFRSV